MYQLIVIFHVFTLLLTIMLLVPHTSLCAYIFGLFIFDLLFNFFLRLTQNRSK